MRIDNSETVVDRGNERQDYGWQPATDNVLMAATWMCRERTGSNSAWESMQRQAASFVDTCYVPERPGKWRGHERGRPAAKARCCRTRPIATDYPRKGSGTSRVKPLSINRKPSAPRPALKPSKDRFPMIRNTEANTIAIWRNAWLQSK